MKDGAFAIIQDGTGRFLCSLRRDMELWNLPGGAVEEGEAPWDAVVREVLEETCLEARVVRLQGIYKKKKQDTTVFSFVCEVTGGALSPTDEAKTHRFYAVDELPENMSRSQKERLQDFLDAPDTVTMKVQNHPPSKELFAHR